MAATKTSSQDDGQKKNPKHVTVSDSNGMEANLMNLCYATQRWRKKNAYIAVFFVSCLNMYRCMPL